MSNPPVLRRLPSRGRPGGLLTPRCRCRQTTAEAVNDRRPAFVPLTRYGRPLRDLLIGDALKGVGASGIGGSKKTGGNAEGGCMKFVVIGCLCAGALAAVGCADGRGVPTSPSATAACLAWRRRRPAMREPPDRRSRRCPRLEPETSM